MINCQACGTEIIGRDRFCRQCGAAVAMMTEFVDTQRFATSSSAGETTRQFYAPPAVVPGVEPVTPVKKNFFQHKVFWIVAVLFLLSSLAAGIGILAVENQRDQQQEVAEAAEINQRALEIAVQNALGFKHAEFPASEFPGVQGIFVNSLMSDDSAAALANLQAGDVLVELNQQAVRNETELEQALNALQTGQEVPIKFYRDGEMMIGKLRLADRNFPPLMPKLEAREQGFLGIKDARRRCCVPNTKKFGIEVIELYGNGPADLFGLKVGDVITEFNGVPTRTPNEFNRRIRSIQPRSKVQIKFYRGNTEQTAEVLIGHRWEDPE